jgi:DNA-binding CsgD family transcriptional regulator
LPAACTDFLEAAYAWELDEAAWLRGVTKAFVRIWGKPHWAAAWVYDASAPNSLYFGSPVTWGASSVIRRMLKTGLPRHEQRPQTREMYRTLTIGFGRPMQTLDPEAEKTFAATKTADMFGLNGLDASGLGCMVAIGAERTTLTPQELATFPRLSAHLSSAYRCRRRLQSAALSIFAQSEAVLDGEGKVLDASGPAKTRAARDLLSRATRSMQAVRRGNTRYEPTSRWQPRVDGRWTLVEAHDRQREGFIVARENQTQPRGLEALTEREREVVASAIAGRTSKEIAYDLGISSPTTRVLLARAYRRLGVRTQRELFALPSIRALRGMPLSGPRSSER